MGECTGESALPFKWYSLMRTDSIGGWDSLLVEHQTGDRKVAGSNPGGTARQFSSPELTLCADSYSASVPP